MNATSSTKARKIFGQKVTFRQISTSRLFWGGSSGGLLLLVLGGLMAASGGPERVDKQPEVRPLPVKVVVAANEISRSKERMFTGLIRASRQSDLGIDRTARIERMLVRHGDRVEKGDLIAVLDARSLQAKWKELDAQRRAAQAVLDELVEGPRAEAVAAARAKVNELESDLALLKLQHERNEKLMRGRSISKNEFDETNYGVQAAVARRDAARRQLEELENGTRQEQLLAQRATIEQLDASLEDVEVEIEDSELTAPYAGVIAERYLHEGTVAAAGTPVVSLVEVDHLEAWVGLPPELASRLEVGTTHQLSLDETPVEAVVKSLAPQLNRETRTQTVVFDITGSSSRQLVPGRVIRVRISTPSQTSGFWLPAEALTRGSRGLWSVYVVETLDGSSGQEGDTAMRRDVEILETQGEEVLVRGTLQAGDRIVSTGTHRLVQGQNVSIIQ